MKKTTNKGFTLIELLSVIVILAIIALIAVPVIMNIIDKANKAAFKDTAYGIINAGELYFAERQLEPNGMLNNETIDLSSTTKLELKGQVPEGQILITKDGKTALAVQNGRYCITKGINDTDVIITEDLENCELPEVKTSLPVTWYAGTDYSNLPTILDSEGNVFAYKVSDYAETMEKLEGVELSAYMLGQSEKIILSKESEVFTEMSEDFYSIVNVFFINLKENNQVDGLSIPETGLYVLSEGISLMSFSFGAELKSNVVVTKNSINWDGNTMGLECVRTEPEFADESSENRIGFCKVSNEIPSINPEDYNKISYYEIDDNEYLTETFDVASISEDKTYIRISKFGTAVVILENENSFWIKDLTKGIWFAVAINNETNLLAGYTNELLFNENKES